MRRTAFAFGALAVLAAGGHATPGTPIGFGTPVALTASGNPIGCAVADVTGDGKADLVLAANRAATVSVLAGNGDGTFAPAFTAPTHTSEFSTRVRAARLNGDAAFDLVVDHQGTSCIDVLLSNGSGGFALTTYFPSVVNTQGEVPSLLDWDGDQDIDILTASSDGKVRIRLNDGTGAFASAADVTIPDALAGQNYRDVVTADLDADGRTNLALRTSIRIEVYWRQADGSLSTGPKLQLVNQAQGMSSKGLVAADFDGDGWTDVAGVVPENTFDGKALVEVFRHTAARTFASAETHRIQGSPWDLAAADLNGDGRPEIVAPTDVLVNSGDGTFGPALALPVGGWGVAVGNVDSGATPDIAVATFLPSGGQIIPIQLAGSPAPTAALVTPSILYLGGTRDVVVTGTGFEQGAELDLGAGVSVNSTTVESASVARANVTVAVNAATGVRPVTVKNPSGGRASTGVTVAADGSAQLVRLVPDRAHVGDVLDVKALGAGFLAGLTATLGAGVTVNTVRVNTDNQFVLNVTLGNDATIGDHDLTMRNGSGIESVAPGVFAVLPARSIDLVAERGRLKPSARPGRGAFTSSGSLRFNSNSPDTRFLPASETSEIRFGDPSEPIVLQVPPDEGWRIRGGRATWRSPRGATPRVALDIDFDRHSFRLSVARAALAALPSDDVVVEFTLGGETGTSTRAWTRARRGGGLVLR